MIQQACERLVKRLKPRARGLAISPPQKPTATEEAKEVISGWLGQAQSTTELMLEAWEARWKRGFHPDPLKTTQPADTTPIFSNKALKKHENLTKAESSLLIQARTGAIGLNDFLFRARVPEISTPYCECGQGKETVEHLVVWCPHPPKPRGPWAQKIRTRNDLYKALLGGAHTQAILAWLTGLGKLTEYRLSVKIAEDLEKEAEAEAGQ